MFILVIQAGGESHRMGRDKGLVPFLGVPLVERLFYRLRAAANEVLVVTNRPGDYRFLDVPLVGDLLPRRGALGGLYTALSAAQERGAEAAGLVACDMPFASPALFTFAYRLLLESGSDAAIPRTLHGNEPFHAVYRPSACLPRVKAALDAGSWRADAWFPQARLRFMLPAEYEACDPAGVAFLNVNTQEECMQAERKARELGETEPKV